MHWRSKLIHPGAHAPANFRSLATPTYRGSTVVFTVVLDNTYAAGVLFDAFAHGVDVSMQALTKYVGGHSDLLLGTVSVAGAAAYEAVGSVYKQLGMAVSPDDCSLAIRGLQSLGVRLERLEKTALEVARWLARHPNIDTVLHPALD